MYSDKYPELNTMLDLQELKNLQDCFCRTTGVYAYCLDSVGMAVTEPSGNPEDIAKFREVISEEDVQDIFRRVSGSSLEDQAIENTIVPNLKYGAIAVKYEQKTIITWIIFAALTDAEEEGYDYKAVSDFSYMLKGVQMTYAMDLLREGSVSMLSLRMAMTDIWAENRRKNSSEEELQQGAKRRETMTEIVQMLDSDDKIEAVMQQILQRVGSQLGISNCHICQMKEGHPEYMDIVVEWLAEGVVSSYDGGREQIRPAYLKTESVLAISSENENADSFYLEEMEEQAVKAMIVMPIMMDGAVRMYAVFQEKRTERTWTMDELKFVNDSVRILQSIITRRMQKNALADTRAALEMTLDSVGYAVYARDKTTGQIIFANRGLRQAFQRELSKDFLGAIFEAVIPEGQTAGREEVYYRKKKRWYDLHYADITWMDGKTVLLCSIYDVTEKIEYQQKIDQLTHTDFLTGLYNRTGCERDLARYMEHAKEGDKKGALLYLDLDDFKRINDDLGHQYGDVLLQSIAQNMQSVDAISDTCYRLGDDEFVIIIPPEKNHLIDGVVDSIKQIFNGPWFLKGANYDCTMSMGIVYFSFRSDSNGDDVQSLINKADIAMREAKRSGKNRVVVYSDEMAPLS